MDESSDTNVEEEFPSETTALANGNATTLMEGITFLQAFAIFINMMMGSGMFITPSLVAARTPNMFIAVTVWLFAGGLCLLGSSCLCEIASIVKKTGGQYIFVYQCYGRLVGYVFIWMVLIILIPFYAGVFIYTFGIYACAPFFVDQSSVSYIWTSKIIGIFAYYVAVMASIIGVSFTAKLTYFFNIVQIIFLLFFTGIGIYYATITGNISNLSPRVMFNNTWSGLQERPWDLVAAIFSALYTMDGWSEGVAFVEEINDPAKNIPLLHCTAIPLVIIIYVGITVVSLLVLTQQEMASSMIVLANVVEKGAGKYFGYVVPVFAAASVFAAMLSFLYAYPRFILSAAREGQLPSIFGLVERKSKVPVIAIIYAAVVGTISALFGEYVERFIQYINIDVWIQCGVTVSIVLYLRKKLPNVQRTYRVWITTPVVVIFISIILLVFSLWRSPLEIGSVMLVTLLGIPVYFLPSYKCWCSRFFPIDFVDKVCDKLGLVKCIVKTGDS